MPGAITWGLIILSVGLSFRWPEVVAWFVLTFDVYWLYKAVMLTGSVAAAFTMMRRALDVDWRARTFALRNIPGRIAEIEARLGAVESRVVVLEGAGERVAATGGRREAARLRDERKELLRLLARRGQPIANPDRLWHVALVPTYTEPYEKLHETIRALAEADWPRDRKMVAIITRETDHGGRENVARLRETFGDQFLEFFHILDPLEPGIVVGKSSAMAYGGRWLYRELSRLGFDPREVLVTDLDSDYRVHPRYFGYLSWTFLTDPDRFRRLYQPVPMFHNNLWATPLPVRLVAIGATHVHMWRSLTPEKLISFSSYSVSLQTVHEVDYWATDAIPEDSRFYWKSFFRYSGEFQHDPAVHADLRRRGPRPLLPAQPDPAVHPDPALGVGRHRHPVLHPERLRPLGDPPHAPRPAPPRPLAGSPQLGDRAVRDPLRIESAAGPEPGVRPDDARPEPAALCLVAADRGVRLPRRPDVHRGADRAAPAGGVGAACGTPSRASSGCSCRSWASCSRTCRRSMRRRG